jgi:nucleoside-diphosphate-sugar epimerase
MRILVTGNLGYVGSHLTDLLVKSGHKIVGCDLSLFPEAVCGELVEPLEQWRCDFRELNESSLTNIDAIAHLAGISNDPMGELNPGLTMSINGKGTLDLAKCARAAGVKVFAFASSCSLYGSSSKFPRMEGDETNPLSEYATSKLFAENGLAQLKSSDFHVYLLRNATAFGASMVFRSDLVVNDLSTGMCANGAAEIRSDGSPWRPLIHCRDMARAFQIFLELNPTQISGKPINIGFNSENFQVKEIGLEVQRNWPGSQLSYIPNAASDPRDYKVNFSLLESIFPNFLPEYRLRKGIMDLGRHLERIGYSKDDRVLKRYVRLQELQKRISELS